MSSVQWPVGETDLGNKEHEDTREHGSDKTRTPHDTSFTTEGVYLRERSVVRERSGLHETDESDEKVQVRHLQRHTEQQRLRYTAVTTTHLYRLYFQEHEEEERYVRLSSCTLGEMQEHQSDSEHEEHEHDVRRSLERNLHHVLTPEQRKDQRSVFHQSVFGDETQHVPCGQEEHRVSDDELCWYL